MAKAKKFCVDCAKKDEKVYLKIVRKTVSMTIKACPKCNKRVIINRRKW